MKAITMITLTAMLMASVMAEEDDGGRSEMSNFIGGVYKGNGSFAMTRNVANGPSGSIIRSGNTFFTPEGVYRKVGNTYLCNDGVVVSTGKSFVGYDHFVARAGSTFVGDYTSVSTRSTILRLSRASR
jgi:hypothetical protein